MKLPKVGDTYHTERSGIVAVQSYAALRKQVWRETNTGDVGIDGNFEFVSPEGHATGRLVAVQVKSGPSYFKNETVNGWKYYPGASHRNYWEGFPLPVLLVLHNPATSKTYWADARQTLRSPKGEQAYIEVPSLNVLEETEPSKLFENAGVQTQEFIVDLGEVLRQLLSTKSRNGSFPLSYFDLFAQGLTNMCRSIYYGTDAICNAVEFNLESSGSEFGMGMGDEEHEFAFNFVKFLLAQNLAQIDYADCLIDWVDRQVHPHFVAPLTSRGRELVILIGMAENDLIAKGKIEGSSRVRVAQDGFFGMVLPSYISRLPRIREFQSAFD
jgi:hypothetical protein